MPHFCSIADYEVLMPMLEEPVHYDIRFESHVAVDDTLSPAHYVVNWKLDTPSGPSTGFDSYYTGNHFRFRNNRLSEYHYDTDATPFAPSGQTSDGVQQSSQFVELLPQFIGRHLQEMITDSTYHYKSAQTDKTITISGTRDVAGYECQEYSYTFDLDDGRPLAIAIENNPGQLGEQSISVSYSYDTDCHFSDGINYDALLTKYSDEFSLYRQSTYTLENMPGKRLPKFNAQTLDGSRYTYSDKTSMPMIIVFLDSDVASTPEVVTTVRKACASLPFATNTIWAYTSGTANDIAEQIGNTTRDEIALISIRGLARDCGIVNTPTILFCDTSGTIREYIYGYNSNLYQQVMQHVAICSKY
jgi:hypothetical protein